MLWSDCPGTGQGCRASLFDFEALAQLAGNKVMARAPCPLCSPMRKPSNRKLPVLTIWRVAPDFVTFSCNHCLEHGGVRDGQAKSLSRAELVHRIREGEQHHISEIAKQKEKARWLWRQARPIAGTIVERYLGNRSIAAVPPTLRFLPARGYFPPAMLAAFAHPCEPEPGRYELGSAAVPAVHLTRLLPDGSGKAPDVEGSSKIMVGVTDGWPIGLVPPNDAGGLAVAEGIEDALSLHQALGIGVWAAGSASRLPKLAPLIARLPYIESVLIAQDADPAGRQHAGELAASLRELRGRTIEVATIEFGEAARDAA